MKVDQALCLLELLSCLGVSFVDFIAAPTPQKMANPMEHHAAKGMMAFLVCSV
jgi:hypothetical protein